MRRTLWAAALALVLSAEPSEPSDGLSTALAECEGKAYIAEDTYPISCECLRACVEDGESEPEDCIGLCD